MLEICELFQISRPYIPGYRKNIVVIRAFFQLKISPIASYTMEII
jgi:hypothetical protein